MTAVASPPSFSNLSRPTWAVNGGQPLGAMNPDEVRGMLGPRKAVQRTNSSSSIASSSSASSTGTAAASPQTNGNTMQAAGDLSAWSGGAARKRPQKGQWTAAKPEGQPAEFGRPPAGRAPTPNGVNGAQPMHQSSAMLASQGQIVPQNGMPRPGTEVLAAGGQPVLYLLSLNGTFERKTISVPFYPETLRIGRQTNAKTVPTPVNGFFDSKVLSRQHAEIWADRSGKIWIRDVKSSNGTFVNGTRLSQENRESEPQELQPQDHLELGIDIVSEDQKTVVHHKVAAKVEHAGFVSSSNSLLDLTFGDLDASNNGMPPIGGAPIRGRSGSQASAGGRAAPAGGVMSAQPNGVGPQRQYWLSPVTTEHIVKRLRAEMRSAHLQHEDLQRTEQFLKTLSSKDDIRNQDKPEPFEHQKHPMINGAGISFRSDGGKTRFSDPPAPPPSQPLPEKPDAARPHNADVPSLKRAMTDRPRLHPSNATSPVRQENIGQIIQLTEALNSAKKEIDNHSARVRELEELFRKEREARLQAENMVHQMEELKSARANGYAEPPGADDHLELERAFEPPAEMQPAPPSGDAPEPPAAHPSQSDKAEAAAAVLRSQIDSMVLEVKALREQLESCRQRAEKAEAERDTHQKSLAELVMQIRQRDEEEKRAAERKSRDPSKNRGRAGSSTRGKGPEAQPALPGGTASEDHPQKQEGTGVPDEDLTVLSRTGTLTPVAGGPNLTRHDQAMMQSLPYASMVGVVLVGMGLMAYLNGWQASPRVDR